MGIPPHTHQSPRTLAAFRPWGVGGVTPCGGSRASVASLGTQMFRNPVTGGFG